MPKEEALGASAELVFSTPRGEIYGTGFGGAARVGGRAEGWMPAGTDGRRYSRSVMALPCMNSSR